MAFEKIPDRGGATANVIVVGEFTHPLFLKTPVEAKRIFDDAPKFKFRDDDVMLCAYQKTGTHWSFDILTMILNKSADQVKRNKLMSMIECEFPEDIDKLPSPRVINSHYPYRYLPVEDMKKKQIKTVLICRNPKDTSVSYYNHMRGIKHYRYEGKWEDWLPVYLQGKFEYGKYTDYLLEWEDAIKKDVGFPLHIMYYENLKINGQRELEKLLQFLGVELNDGLKQDILRMCRFDSMASKEIPDHVVDAFFKENFRILRKGQIGDWKNWFTPEQNTMFDEIWNREMKDSTTFEFIYTDQRS